VKNRIKKNKQREICNCNKIIQNRNFGAFLMMALAVSFFSVCITVQIVAIKLVGGYANSKSLYESSVYENIANNGFLGINDRDLSSKFLVAPKVKAGRSTVPLAVNLFVLPQFFYFLALVRFETFFCFFCYKRDRFRIRPPIFLSLIRAS